MCSMNSETSLCPARKTQIFYLWSRTGYSLEERNLTNYYTMKNKKLVKCISYKKALWPLAIRTISLDKISLMLNVG